MDFVDKVLAYKQMANSEVTITRRIADAAELNAFLHEVAVQHTQDIAADRSLSNPAKIESLRLPDDLRAMALGFVAVRTALEHHKARPRHDIDFGYKAPVYVVGDRIIDKFPIIVEPGQQIGYRYSTAARRLKAGEQIVFTEGEIESIALTILLTIAPAVVHQLGAT